MNEETVASLISQAINELPEVEKKKTLRQVMVLPE